MRQPLIAGNWKMNGSQTQVRQLIDGIKAGIGSVSRAQVAVCPPFPYLSQAAEMLAGSGIGLGAQDVSNEDVGAFTGQVAASMLKDLRCDYVIVGHSERRLLNSETDELVAQKTAKAIAAGLTPILCVGETLAEREAGETEAVVARQLDAVIEACGVEQLAHAVIAYEPVWAIGTGVTATPEQAQEVHGFLRERIRSNNADVAERVQILYGGSMKPGNAVELIAQPDIDGGLIGGAALEAEDFLAICQAGHDSAA